MPISSKNGKLLFSKYFYFFSSSVFFFLFLSCALSISLVSQIKYNLDFFSKFNVQKKKKIKSDLLKEFCFSSLIKKNVLEKPKFDSILVLKKCKVSGRNFKNLTNALKKKGKKKIQKKNYGLKLVSYIHLGRTNAIFFIINKFSNLHIHDDNLRNKKRRNKVKNIMVRQAISDHREPVKAYEIFTKLLNNKMYEVDRLLESHSKPTDPLQVRMSYLQITQNKKLSEMIRLHKSEKMSKYNKQILSLVADVKRFSPTNPDRRYKYCMSFDSVEDVSLQLAETSFDVLMINTDHLGYGGCLNDLEVAVRTVKKLGREKRPAIVMKDIIIHPIQIALAAEYQADGILLNSMILGADLSSMLEMSMSIGIEAIVEVHTPEQTLHAVECGANILLLNEWDRLEGRIQINRSVELQKLVPSEIMTIGAGAIESMHQVEELASLGIDAICLGRKLAADDLSSFAQSIKSWESFDRQFLRMNMYNAEELKEMKKLGVITGSSNNLEDESNEGEKSEIYMNEENEIYKSEGNEIYKNEGDETMKNEENEINKIEDRCPKNLDISLTRENNNNGNDNWKNEFINEVRSFVQSIDKDKYVDEDEEETKFHFDEEEAKKYLTENEVQYFKNYFRDKKMEYRMKKAKENKERVKKSLEEEKMDELLQEKFEKMKNEKISDFNKNDDDLNENVYHKRLKEIMDAVKLNGEMIEKEKIRENRKRKQHDLHNEKKKFPGDQKLEIKHENFWHDDDDAKGIQTSN